MPVCDSCGAEGDDAHIRRRIERLELATRFRPIHISVLLVDSGPPVRFEDYFYRATKDRSERSPASREYFDALVNCAGVIPGPDLDEDASLAEFQRHGFFVVGALECALAGRGDPAKAIEGAAAALLRRVNISYKPKFVAFLSGQTQCLVPFFQGNGWGPRLILLDGKPFGDSLLTGRLARAVGQTGER
jgi:hypothetical protein